MAKAPEPAGRSAAYANSLTAWLKAGLDRDADAVAALTASESMSFAQLQAAAMRLAAGLRKLGIGKGEIVAVQLPNDMDFLVCWLAIAFNGSVLQTLHMPYGAGDIENLVRDSGAAALILPTSVKGDERALQMLRLQSVLPNLRFVIAAGQAPGGCQSLQQLRACPETIEPVDPGQGTDPYVQLYTSGTTSSPKGVAASHEQFLDNACEVSRLLQLSPSDRVLCVAPSTHLYGLHALEISLCAGACICLLPTFSAEGLRDAVESMRPTVVIAGPAHFATAFAEGLLGAQSLSSVRLVMLSGAKVPPELAARVEEAISPGRVVQLWGMTELQAGACGRPDDPEATRMGSVGRAVPGVSLRIADGERELPAGEVGELQARGRSVFTGYVGNPDATAASFTSDGWFRTGDLASIDADGFVVLQGRSKDIINRGGVKFNPADVEAILTRHPALLEVAIAPIPDPLLGERACCFAVARAGHTPTLESLTGFLAGEGVSKLKWPERLIVVDHMPMTPTRKVMKAALVREHASE